MSISNDRINRQLAKDNYKKRFEQLKMLMTPINANRGKDNCGHVSVRLNSYLRDLNKMMLKQEEGSAYSITPVPTDNAKHFYTYIYPSKRRIEAMSTDNPAILVRCMFDPSKVTEMIDLTKEDGKNETTILIDITTESQSNIKSALELKHATEDNIVYKLRQLPRRIEDNTAFGFLIYAHPGTLELHSANFFVDTDNQVYFLDAQPNPVYIKDRPPSGFIKDIFYVSSVPELSLEKSMSVKVEATVTNAPSSSTSIPASSGDAKTKIEETIDEQSKQIQRLTEKLVFFEKENAILLVQANRLQQGIAAIKEAEQHQNKDNQGQKRIYPSESAVTLLLDLKKNKKQRVEQNTLPMPPSLSSSSNSF